METIETPETGNRGHLRAAAVYNVGTDDFNTMMEGRRFRISMTAEL
jgi:hypothetical protein